MPEILGDTTRIGALELKVRALSINNDALTNAVKTMRQTVRELKHAADNADMKEEPGIKFPLETELTDHTKNMIDSLLYGSPAAAKQARKKTVLKCMDVLGTGSKCFTATTPGWYSFNGQEAVALEADDEHDLAGLSYPIVVTFVDDFIEPPTEIDEKHEGCSVDVLCLNEDGAWDVGYYDYGEQEWTYNAMPDYHYAPIRWEFLPE